ncbi:MAG TPA: FG-GAP-like repeat-containing protein [Cyclobacteriaceae bacterium]|nr:FG-GAP-like repeat-containing protein [Cyclobacteriaceae bacterium]
MKKIVTALLLLVIALQSNAQTFIRRQTIRLDEKLTGMSAGWIAMDTDTLLDFVLTGVGSDNQLKIYPFQNADLIKKPAQLTGMNAGNMQIVDWNKDNKLDLLISGTGGLYAFTGNGNFTFTKQSPRLLDHSGRFLIADMNNNGVHDIITYSEQFIRIYENGVMTFNVPANVVDLSVFDMNNDQLDDIVSSTFILYNNEDFRFTRKDIPGSSSGAISLADINDDGLFDLIAANGLTFINHRDTLIAGDPFTSAQSIFTGDITSDGKSDILLSKKQSNYIQQLSGAVTKLDTTGLIVQRMGDHDRDGDLDLVQVTDSIGSQWLKFFENTSVAVNDRPNAPSESFAISTFNKTFIFWQGADDDHTNPGSLTYDVWLGNAQKNIIQPSYDLGNLHRSAVRHGNAGTNTAMVINQLTDNRYFYGIQTVDNAYNGSYEYGTGGGGGILPCFDLFHTDVQACKGLQVKLSGGKGATWYSTSKRLLGTADTLQFIASANDTLFAFVPQSRECGQHKIYIVHVNEAPPSEQQTIYACKNKEITLEIPKGWNVAPKKYLVTKPDTVVITAASQGCTYKKTFVIKISEPSVAINGDGFQVLKGNSVQLEATGNVETWQWDPPTGLSNAGVANPTATPPVSTEYVVTGTDSVGCTATARVNVFVQENAFLPNLFTPNGDGKNDNLMIYGLTNPSRFNFRIFNREGSLVYETKDADQATTTGWNGFVSGTRQPGGIYYWRIDGEMSNGDKLMLNGKTSGSILLVH